MIDLLNRVKKVNYAKDLNARQQEQHLFQKVSAVMADYGYATIKLSDDWQGADFIVIAQNDKKSGEFFKVQLKGRFTLAKKYLDKDLYVAFPLNLEEDQWCIYPHDEVISRLEAEGLYLDSKSWEKSGGEYHVPKISKKLEKILSKYMMA
jgi:hypothetical protein